MNNGDTIWNLVNGVRVLRADSGQDWVG